ncbi:hypothetical protein M3M38_07255 [Fructilactobacillus cliffordii]|uniref:hypothetical protein n=1 Tax=Fructilactobacillus cliffordii TaxID=2940299 RepID=UPI0020926B86|nr:hypothetical protein [Fructilactobacillus cliffordii]USS86456.1 hypothetical protein M3M38_07255 [Fructilactobacillus cliffordii]
MKSEQITKAIENAMQQYADEHGTVNNIKGKDLNELLANLSSGDRQFMMDMMEKTLINLFADQD